MRARNKVRRNGLGFLSVLAVSAVVAAVLAAGPAAAETVNVQGTGGSPYPLADNDTTTFTFPITESGAVQSVELQLAMDHTFPEDLTVTLSSPEGTAVTIMHQMGVQNIGSVPTAEFQDIVFEYDPAAPRRIGNTVNDTSPFVGVFQIQGPATPDLDAFVGEEASGTWTLTIVDSADEDTGSIYADGDTAPWETADGTKLTVTVPEPATLGLLLAAVPLIRRRRGIAQGK